MRAGGGAAFGGGRPARLPGGHGRVQLPYNPFLSVQINKTVALPSRSLEKPETLASSEVLAAMCHLLSLVRRRKRAGTLHLLPVVSAGCMQVACFVCTHLNRRAVAVHVAMLRVHASRPLQVLARVPNAILRAKFGAGSALLCSVVDAKQVRRSG